MPEVGEVEVVDPQPEALSFGRERLAEIPGPKPTARFRWLSSLEDASLGGDVCIVATQADVRCQLVRQIATGLGYSRFLLEKVVAQSLGDYEALMRFSRERGLLAWVNCKTRAYPIHKRIKEWVDSADPVLVNVVGGNHGLATNGIHAADLFAFYDGSGHIEIGGSHIDQVLHPSKRANGLFDLSGTLSGHSSKGSLFSLSYAGDHDSPEHISITTPRYRCIVDHSQRWAFESNVATAWEWKMAPFDGNLLVSEMTKAFALDIMTHGRCELPTLEECFVAHRFILGELLPHFNKLLDQEGDRCPVT